MARPIRLNDVVAPDRVARFRNGLALATIVVSPFMVLLVGTTIGETWQLTAHLEPVDVLLAALVLVGPWRALWRSGALGRTAEWFLVAMVASLALHPSVRGVMAIVRVAGAVSLASTLVGATASRQRRNGLVALEVAAGGQLIIAAIQRATLSPIGLRWLGENRFPFVDFGSIFAPVGTMWHTYVLAGLGLLMVGVFSSAVLSRSLTRLNGYLGCAIGGALVAFTYSRAAAVGIFVVVVVTFLAARTRQPRLGILLVAATLIPAGIVGISVREGWVARARYSAEVATTRSSEGLTDGRGEFLVQGLRLARANPLLGVGPGRYSQALADSPALLQRRGLQPAHNVLVLVAAELGIPGVLGLGALALALLRRMRRAGAVIWPAAVSLVPFLLLDHYLWDTSEGAVLTAVWLGIVAGIGRPVAPASRVPEVFFPGAEPLVDRPARTGA